MASSIVEKYERILQADPRSRIFIELARALVDNGDSERAVQVCRRGIEHHPDSVQGRVILGKALLALGLADEAVASFEEAIATDAAGPYSYDLVGEALARHGHPDRALPFMERAMAQHPSDRRIRRWLEEARRRATRPAPSPQQARPPPRAPSPSPRMVAPPPREPAPPPDKAPPPPVAEAAGPTVEARQAAIAEPNGGANAVESSRQVSAAPAPIAASVEPPRLPPPIRPGQGAGANVLDLIPGAEPAAPGFSAWALEPPVSKAEETEATNAARTYEHELREKLLASPTRPGFFHRHALATALAALVIAIGTGAASFAAALAHRRADEARAAVELARKGLARDTQGALREAARVLEKARKAAPDDDEANVLSAEVLGLLAHDFGDAAALASARSLLSTEMGDEALGARWLLAREGEEERDAAQVLLDRAADGRPLERALAGEILLARRDYGGARLHLEAAASANPPLLRALCLLGDLDVARADLEAALKHYALVLHAQPTHPRAALGAASVRFRLGRDLKDALRTLEAVQADKESPVPVADRLRMSLVMSRLLAANGRTAEADARLADTASHNPGQVDVAVAQADVFALEGNLDGALRAAQAALRLAPSSGTRELLARLQLRRGRYRELLASSEQTPSRTLRLYRGIAYFELGELAKARAEIEETRRDGKMTPEAGAWMALAELASGRKAQASAIVSALLAAAAPHPLALVARARIDLAEGHPNDGEKHLRQALERDPELHEARCDLGHLLLSRGRFAEAREVLEKAVARNPYRLEAQRELGQARLSSGDPAGAARDFEVVLAERPHEVPILISLSAARLATGNAADARRAAQRALELEPRSAPAALAAGRAAQALGLSREARHYFEQVTRQGGKAAEAAEARRALASLKR